MGPMRVARSFHKRYNHNGKQNSTAVAGCYQHPTTCSRRHDRPVQQNLCTAGSIIPILLRCDKRIFHTARDYYSLCSVFLFPNIFYKETKSWKSEIRTIPFPPCAAWSFGWHPCLLYPATSSTAPAQSSSSAMTWATPSALSCQ